MKHIVFSTLTILALSSTSCVKSIIDNTKNNTDTDFELRLSRVDHQGNLSVQVEHALNQPNAAVYNTAYYQKENAVHVRIGGVQTTTVLPRLSADIHFKFANKAADISGSYQFPKDNNSVQFYLSENVNSTTTMRMIPVAGYLQISYDSTSKTLSGTVTGLRYDQPLSSNFNNEVLNGKFNHVRKGE